MAECMRVCVCVFLLFFVGSQRFIRTSVSGKIETSRNQYVCVYFINDLCRKFATSFVFVVVVVVCRWPCAKMHSRSGGSGACVGGQERGGGVEGVWARERGGRRDG